MRLKNLLIKVANKPTQIHLSVTENCCLQCKMCDIWRIKKKQKSLDYRSGKVIIDILKNWLDSFYLTFAGGEPFLNRDILKIIKYAYDKKIQTSINSNGYVIDKEIANGICESGLANIFFSIDGPAKQHDFIRGKRNSFKKALQAIQYIKKSGIKRKPKIFINTVISDNNLIHIEKMIEFAVKIKIDGIKFQTLMPNFASAYKKGWWKKNIFWPKDKKLIEKMITSLIINKRKLGNFMLNSNKDFLDFRKYFMDPARFQKQEKCFVGLNNLMIDTSGNVRLCYEMGKIGNLLHEDLDSIWNGQKAKVNRRNIAKCQKPCKLLPCNSVNYKDLIKQYLKNLINFNYLGIL